VKRLLLLVALGAAAAALAGCTTAPPAASVNGTEISQATLNADLSQLISDPYAQCAVLLSSGGQVPNVQGVGTTSRGVANAATTGAAAMELHTLVLDEIERQALTRRDIALTPADVAAAKQDYFDQLGNAAQELSNEGVNCPVSTAQLTTKLPPDFVQAQATSLATTEKVEEVLGGVQDGPGALRRYYQAHLASVNQPCLNLIITTSQAAAAFIQDAVSHGKSFQAVAQATGVAPELSPPTGQVACVYPSQVVGQFGTSLAATIDNLPDGKVVGPLAWTDVSSGTPTTYWLVVQMRQHYVVPLSQLEGQIREILLSQGVSHVEAVVSHLSHEAQVTVDPMYGTWQGLRGITPPTAPPVRFVPNPGANQPPNTASGLTLPGSRPPVPSGG
jgi:hypothetical protein